VDIAIVVQNYFPSAWPFLVSDGCKRPPLSTFIGGMVCVITPRSKSFRDFTLLSSWNEW